MKKANKLVICLLVVFTVCVVMTGCSFGKQNVGTLDLQKLGDTPKLKQLSEQLKAKEKEITDNIDKDKKAGMKEEELSKKYGETFKQMQAFQEELQKKAEDSIRTASEEVAKAKDLSVVLNKMTVLVNGVDITEDVIQKLQ